MSLDPAGVRRFFAYARRRHEIFLRRQAGDPPPWTNDPILQQYRFTNIFREDDRTTIWCREHVREPWDRSHRILPALVIFRWFNKIETGSVLFDDQENIKSVFSDWMCGKLTLSDVRERIIAARGPGGPFVNGAYIIKSPSGMTKLDGVLHCCQKFLSEKMSWESNIHHAWMKEFGWLDAASKMITREWNLQKSWDWLRQYDQQGDFTAYEVITDLRHTYLLRDADDILTWANAGPGAKRGLNRIQGRPLDQQLPKDYTNSEMLTMLMHSTRSHYWPAQWGRWEMREVEHTLCEFDKYERARLGEGSPKQRYHGLAA